MRTIIRLKSWNNKTINKNSTNSRCNINTLNLLISIIKHNINDIRNPFKRIPTKATFKNHHHYPLQSSHYDCNNNNDSHHDQHQHSVSHNRNEYRTYRKWTHHNFNNNHDHHRYGNGYGTASKSLLLVGTILFTSATTTAALTLAYISGKKRGSPEQDTGFGLFSASLYPYLSNLLLPSFMSNNSASTNPNSSSYFTANTLDNIGKDNNSSSTNSDSMSSIHEQHHYHHHNHLPNYNFIADAASQVMDSVVNLKMTILVPQKRKKTNFLHLSEKDMNIISYGSGFIIREDGSILTNAHVVGDLGLGGKLEVTDSKGNRYPGYVFSIDSLSDLAVVKIIHHELSSSPSSDSSERNHQNTQFTWKPVHFGLRGEYLRPGDWVVAIGSPLGLTNTVTAGVVSAVSRRDAAVAAGETRDSRLDFIQTDCVVHTGSSGGPLVNVYGRVIGINTTRAEREGITFAMRIDNAMHIIKQLVNTNQIKRPWLGFKLISLSPELKLKLAESGSEIEIPTVEKGIMLSEVHPESPAGLAGCLQGDVIVEVNGHPVAQTQEFHRVLADHHNVTDMIELTIKRKIPLDMDWDGRIRSFVNEEKKIKVQPIEIDVSIHDPEIESYLVS